MKNKHFIMMSLCLLTSCTTASISSSEPSVYNPSFVDIQDGYETSKEVLKNALNKDNYIEIDEEAINIGLYKPMYKLTYQHVSRLVHPFFNSLNVVSTFGADNVIFLDKYLTREDYDEMNSLNLSSREDYVRFLSSKGYTFKTEITLPNNYYFEELIDEGQINYIDAQTILNRHLFRQDDRGNIVYDIINKIDISPSLTVTVTIKDDIWLKDINCEPVRKLTVSDIINHQNKQYNHSLFKNIEKISDTKFIIILNKELSLEEIQNEMIYIFNDVNVNNLFTKDNYVIQNIEGGYKVSVDDITVNYVAKSLNPDYDYIPNVSEHEEKYHLPLYSNTYGFYLNTKGGNEAYKTALDNTYFRLSLLNILNHENMLLLTTNPTLYNRYSGDAYNIYSGTYQTNSSTKSVEINESKEEATRLYDLAKEQGLNDETIELYVEKDTIERVVNRNNYLKNIIDEIYKGKVVLVEKTTNQDFGSSRDNNNSFFYTEVELDGYKFSEKYSYIENALI